MNLENIYIDIIKRSLVIEQYKRASDTGDPDFDFTLEKDYEKMDMIPLSDLIKMGELLERCTT